MTSVITQDSTRIALHQALRKGCWWYDAVFRSVGKSTAPKSSDQAADALVTILGRLKRARDQKPITQIMSAICPRCTHYPTAGGCALRQSGKCALIVHLHTL